MNLDPDWITAWATAITAILTGTGGLAAWLALRREQLREMPIVERTVHWDDGHLILKLTITNRLPETLILDSVEITRPRGTTISDSTGPGDKAWSPGPPVPGVGPVLPCRFSINRAGSEGSQHSVGDIGYRGFSVWPPTGWSSGHLKIVLRVSSKAETIRNKRMVIKHRVPEAPRRQTEVTVSEAD